jgi:hypothetical protein
MSRDRRPPPTAAVLRRLGRRGFARLDRREGNGAEVGEPPVDVAGSPASTGSTIRAPVLRSIMRSAAGPVRA